MLQIAVSQDVKSLIVPLLLLVICLVGCNPTDAKDIAADGGKLAETAARSASNAGVAASVNTMLGLHKDVDLAGLHIEADGGTVTVGGHVKTAKEKKLVLELANKTRRVEKVVDKLRVEP